jgi:hypothetical protein
MTQSGGGDSNRDETRVKPIFLSATAIPWMVALARISATGEQAVEIDPDTVIMEQVERIEGNLEKFGTLHDRSFSKREAEILTGLNSTEKGPFEQAHKAMGEMMGFTAGKVEAEGSPDPWWTAGDCCFVFEDHAGAEDDSALDVTKARQVFTHPNWVKENIPAAKDSQILPVLVTPVTKVREAAVPHLDGVALWPLAEFRKWAADGLALIRELRKTFAEPGDLAWRAQAAESLAKYGYDAPGLMATLKKRPAKGGLTAVK